MELTGLKRINNKYTYETGPTIAEKVASGIGVEGTTGQSTLADRKTIKNLPKFEDGFSFGHYNFAGRPSATDQLASGPNKIPNNLPTSVGGGASFGKTLGNVASAAVPYAGALMQNATAAVDFVSSIGSAGKFNKSADDLLQEAGSAEGNIGGVSYQIQNEIDAQGVSAQTSAENKTNTVGLMGKGAALGASLGMAAGPVGGLIGGAAGAIGGFFGGLFGSSKRKREMRRRVAEAQNKALRQNDFSRSGALTSVMQQNYAREYGDTETQSLYGFKDGKEPEIDTVTGTTIKNYTIETSHGKQKGPQNSWVEKDEVLWDTVGDPLGLNMHVVDHGPNDSARSYLTNTDVVFTNKNDISKMALANAGNPIGLQALMNEQSNMKNGRQNKGFFAAKNGKLPGFAWGLPEWSNFLGNAAGYVTAKADKAKIDADAVSKPDTYQSNSNASQALYILGQQQENPYAIMPELYNTYAKGMYALSNNRGLSGGQRALARLSAMNNLTANAAKLQQAAQSANIAHRQQYADAMLRYGAADAQNRMAALQHDYNAYNQAHGAKLEMSSRKEADATGFMQNGIKGINDWYMFNKMYKLWQDDIKNNSKNNNTGSSSKSSIKNHWDWLPKVYGPLNKNAIIAPSRVKTQAENNPYTLAIDYEYAKDGYPFVKNSPYSLISSYLPQLTVPTIPSFIKKGGRK